jgi:hypothetical protein
MACKGPVVHSSYLRLEEGQCEQSRERQEAEAKVKPGKWVGQSNRAVLALARILAFIPRLLLVSPTRQK